MLTPISPTCICIIMAILNIFSQNDFSHLEMAQPLELRQEQDIYMSVLYLTQDDHGDDVLVINVSNHTSRGVGIWPGISLEVFDGAYWRDAPLDYDRLTGFAGFWQHMIPPESQRNISFRVNPYMPLESGLYRARARMVYFRPLPPRVGRPGEPIPPELPVWWKDDAVVPPPGYSHPRDTHERIRYDLVAEFYFQGRQPYILH